MIAKLMTRINIKKQDNFIEFYEKKGKFEINKYFNCIIIYILNIRHKFYINFSVYFYFSIFVKN